MSMLGVDGCVIGIYRLSAPFVRKKMKKSEMTRQKQLRMVVPFVKEYASTRGRVGQELSENAVAAVLHEDGLNRIKYHYCYGGLKTYGAQFKNNPSWSTNPNLSGKPVAIFLQLQPNPEDLEADAFNHFIEWMINYSPFRHTFISKNMSKVMKDGVVVVDPNTKQQTLGMSIISFRQAWENYYKESRPARYMKTLIWWELVQKIDPTIAFALSNSLLSLDWNGRLFFSTVESGHSPFDMEDRTLFNLARSDIRDDSIPWSKAMCYENGLSHILSHTPAKLSLSTVVKDALLSLDGTKKKSNPFAIRSETKYYDIDKGIDAIAEAINDVKDKLYV